VSNRAGIALRIGYLGDSFHGAQIQPRLRTVQGELVKAIRKLTWAQKTEKQPVQMASRTDAGVHVRVNAAFFDIPESAWEDAGQDGLLFALSHHLEDDIALIDVNRIDDWIPRHASSRTYRYRIECIEGWEGAHDDFDKWCSMFEGHHDFSDFCRHSSSQGRVRKIDVCRPWYSGSRIVGFEVIAGSFAWNQIRRIASALHGINCGMFTSEEVQQSIDYPNGSFFGLAPAEWLTLWSVEWPELSSLGQFEHELKAPEGNLRRWRSMARDEQKMILHREWNHLGCR